MDTIQVVLEPELLRATDAAAKRARLNRSALVRRALRAHLNAMAIEELETRDRLGYKRRPAKRSDSANWERVAVWPER
ncbi:MAG TPA: ribbon-helix-helix protein, CopG family [Candidatus Acidoferrales bacterium]|nr:ribbon-helix-helix protein, CopG family [Candidatus Acidoferrales bacterium]